ncbi:alpha-ketoacid dehydrogenase subunit beta [Natronolimnohabitans innermongolicus]|uniref:Pyruvate dehydrogenase (Acetyl-transferring) E1 component beta subunit n=1 Tax=Natronolimnohabitans innermongolicus JCM 12255 TaxID=1227499 RepID=L9WLB4_9EURY|nr:alpha-ketoacid dehydrogenase subunit beta [Natronolimnohabitans innermongolicus]ELY50172.1 pyruvate dehydrogenase (acetyl-transferring) E1 component beta subunit [Natronolimnohabitans innermongolicus JCM 12255]
MTREITYVEAIAEALDEELSRDDDVILFGEDVEEFGGNFGETEGLYEKHGRDRVRNTPLSEIGIAGMALGAAVGGIRPVAELQFADFAATAGDEVFNQIPKQPYVSGGRLEAPLTIFAPSGAGIGAGAQHSQSVHSWLGNVPGWVVVTATTPYDAKGLFKSAIRDDNPVFFLPHKMLSETKGEVPDEEYTLPLGEAVVEEDGEDVTVVATQLMFHRAKEAAAEVDADVEIVNPRTFAPLDTETIAESVRKTGRLVVVDETVERYGTQGYIANEIVENEFFSFDAPPKTIGVKDVPIPLSPPLEQEVLPSADRIAAGIESLF